MVTQNRPIASAQGLPRAGASFSRGWHGLLRQASRAFGGSYGRAPVAYAAPEEQLTVDAGEVSLRVLRWSGTGTPIVLLHGLNNNAWSWARVAWQLRGKRELLAVSQRGHGGSSAPERGYDLATTTRDLVAMLDRLSLDRVHLGGHSWGGKVACHLAASNPDRVASLLLADPAPPRDLNPVIRSVPWLISATFRSERGPFASRSDWEKALRVVGYLCVGDDTDRALWTSSYEQRDDGSMRHRLPESAYREILERTLAEDIRPMLGGIGCPVLLMRPTFSLSFLPGELRDFRKSLPRLELVHVSGDHTFIHTNSLDTTAAMARFLDKL